MILCRKMRQPCSGRLDVLGLFLVHSLLFLQVPRKALAKCPNWCSQKGICTGPGDDAFCICEMGHQGDDCGTRLCPKGDDPITTDQANRALLLRTTADGGLLSGELSFSFNGEATSMDANAHRAGDHECASALQKLPNIDRVSCKRGPVSEVGGAEYSISLLSFPTLPWENNHYGHFGNPPLESFSCNISGEAGSDESLENEMSPSCELIDLITDNVKEYVECSGHGTCNRETGRCDCSFGFKGDACDDISDSKDAQVIVAEGPFFTGSTLKLHAFRGFSPDFHFIRTLAGPHKLDVMTLSGTGDLTLHKGGLSVQGQLTPGSTRDGAWNAKPPPRAVQVLGGSLGVLGGGAEISSSRTNAPALAISVGLDDALDAKSGGEGADNPLGRRRKHEFSFSGAALSVNVRESSAAEEVLPVRDRFRLLELSVGGKGEDEEGREGVIEEDANILMSVRGDGRVLMRGGGGVVVGEGSLDVSQGNANVKGNAAVGGSLSVGSGGMEVADGGSICVLDGGLRVLSTGKHGDSNSGSSGGGDAVGMLSATHPGFSGDVLRVEISGDGAPAVGAGLLRASAGGQDVFEVKATGATSVKSGGLSVEAGGLRVASGGVTVGSGGLSVDGGIRLRSGTIIIDDNHGDGDGGRVHGSEGGKETKVVGLEVAYGGILAASSDASSPALTATATAKGFGGTVLAIEAPASSPSSSFRLLQATVGGKREGGRRKATNDHASPGVVPTSSSKSEDVRRDGKLPGVDAESHADLSEREVFVVDGEGKITTSGGLETGNHGPVSAGGRLTARGGTVLEMRRAPRFTVDGGSVAEVDASAGTFFEVADDGRAGFPNVLRIKGEAMPGQIMVLHNSDADPTTGVTRIPSGFTVLLIHDGLSWRDLRVTEAAATELRGVKALTAANDLDIGDFTLKARHVASTGNKAGGVALFGGGGLLTADGALTFDSASGTLAVTRLRASEVSGGMDFKGHPARNVALVNATIDRIPFLKTARLMVEAASASGTNDGTPYSTSSSPSKLAGPAAGLAILDKKGELSRAEGITARPGGVLEVRRIGPHVQVGDVDFQGYAARNLTLAEVSALTGLDSLKVRELFLAPSPSEPKHSAKADGTLVVLTPDGQLRPASDAFSVNGELGTLLAPRIGPHDVTGDVDFLGNTVLNALLESPEIGGTVSHLRVEALSMVAPPPISRGLIAVFTSSPEEGDVDSDDGLVGGSKSLGRAGLAWREGALQNVRLGGKTTLEGDLDMGGHRLLNFDLGTLTGDLDHVEELTIGRALTLEHHAGSTDSLLVVGAGGVVAPVNPADLNVRASSATITGAVISDQLTCKGPAEMGGEVFVAGDVTVRGKVILGAGMNAGGATIANVQLEGVKFRGAVAGDVGLDGSLTIDALKTEGGGMVAVGPRGTLMTARGVTYDEDGGVLVVKKLSGHKVVGDVDFAGRALLSPSLNFSSGGSVAGLASLRVGDGGLEVSGQLRAASDVSIAGSLTVSGQVIGLGPYMDSSDARLKDDVRDLSSIEAVLGVRRLRAVKYVPKSGEGVSLPGASRGKKGRNRQQHGFIAQEVENIVPEVVFEDAKGFKAVAYSRLVPILARALSAALDRLDNLEHVAVRAPENTWSKTGGSSKTPPSSYSSLSENPVGHTGTAEHHGDSRGGHGMVDHRGKYYAMGAARAVDDVASGAVLEGVAGGLIVVDDVAVDKRENRRLPILGPPREKDKRGEEAPVAMTNQKQHQLLAENSDLRARVSKLEGKVLDVERRMALMFGASGDEEEQEGAMRHSKLGC